jgi:nucleotide-binding universal stress UspA family protein
MLPLKKILCPTDFSEPSYEGVKAANEFALHFSAELTMLHVVSPVPIIPSPEPTPGFDVVSYQQEMELYAVKSLDKLVKEKISEKATVHKKIVIGSAADEIIRSAKDEKMDIIVIATHGLTGWRRFVFGSVAEKVVRLAQ